MVVLIRSLVWPFMTLRKLIMIKKGAISTFFFSHFWQRTQKVIYLRPDMSMNRLIILLLVPCLLLLNACSEYSNVLKSADYE